jgi:Rap1a immunity proteins
MNMKKRWFITLALANLIVGGVAHAADGEAVQFVERCKAAITYADSVAPNSVVAMNIGFCFGVIDGVRGANFYHKEAKSTAAFCEPANLKNDDLAKVFVAMVDKNPDLKELRGSLAVLVSLKRAFPCKSLK